MSVQFYVAQKANVMPLEDIQVVAATPDPSVDIHMIVSLHLLTQHGITPEQCAGGVVIDEQEVMELVNKEDLEQLKDAASQSNARDKFAVLVLGRLKLEKEISSNLEKQLTQLNEQHPGGKEHVAQMNKPKSNKKKSGKKSSKNREDSSTAPGQDDMPQESIDNHLPPSTEMPALEHDLLVVEDRPVEPDLESASPAASLEPGPPVAATNSAALAKDLQDLRAEFTEKLDILSRAFDHLLVKSVEQREVIEVLTEQMSRLPHMQE